MVDSATSQSAALNLQEKNFKDREETLKRKDIDLQESLIRFSKFLQDNDAKRIRALKKAADERKTREEKEREFAETVKLHTPTTPMLPHQGLYISRDHCIASSAPLANRGHL